jgi:transglutaminase-like putative cysteine protease
VNHRFTITAAIASAAASTALLPLVSGGKWFFGGLGAIIVVAAVGTATRHRALRALPAVVCLLCALVALVLYLNLIYSASYSFLHLLPDGRSLAALWRNAVSALRATKSQTPPVPASVGIDLVASGGIGLVAALTDLIAVRLRRCALAGLPLLVLFSVPVATDAGANPTENTFVFCVGMAGYLALLSADGRERLRLWGRLVTPWNAARPDETVDELGGGPSSRALAASGRRIGGAAVVLALCSPLLIPGLHAQRLFDGTGNGSGPGGHGGNGQGNVSVNPEAQMTLALKKNPSTVFFTYTTNDTHPQYLMEEVLGQLSDTAASLGQMDNPVPVGTTGYLPPIPGLGSTPFPIVHTKVTMQTDVTLSDGFLPVPYAPQNVTVSVSNVEVIPNTLMVATNLASVSNLTYEVTSEDVYPSKAQETADTAAQPAGLGYYLEVPKDLQSLGTLARHIAGNATTEYGKVEALLGFFDSGSFVYSLNGPTLSGRNSLYDFLTKTRTGYCQQFSFAMTVLARLLGIPARVAVGFLPGQKVGKDSYQVHGSDAHAWTQLYFPGYGWTTWDPTPSGNEVGQAGIPPSFSVPPGVGGHGTNGTSPPSSVTAPNHNVIGPGIGRERHIAAIDGGAPGVPVTAQKTAVTSSNNDDDAPIALVVVAALLAIGLVTPRIVRSLTRRRRWTTARGDAGVAHAAWAELLDNLTDFGVGYGPGETPRTLTKRIQLQQKLAEPVRQALDRLAQAEERASYAREPAAAGALSADVATVRGAVSASVTRSARWRAWLMPPSSVAEIQRVTSHMLDTFGWLEVTIGRLAKHLPRVRTNQG